jgi:uncharacterized membrane protein YGL010W
MVKTVRSTTGRKTALVVVGWIAFLAGQFAGHAVLTVPLLAIARVLP